MIKGYPAYTCFGKLSPLTAQTKKLLRFKGQAAWVEESKLEAADSVIWGEEKWDFSGRTNIEDIQFVLAYKADPKQVFDAYGKLGDDELEFGVRVWNFATRRRTWHKGSFKVNTSGNIEATFDSTLDLRIRLSDFDGKIEITPLLLTTSGALRDSKRKIPIQRGTILGWADPIVIDLQAKKTGLGSIFDIRWKSFSSDQGTENQFFRVEWSHSPILYLNEDNQILKQVLMTDAPVGRAARVRDAINSLIAHQVISGVLSAALFEFCALAENGEGATEIIEDLSPQNEAVLRQWGWMLTHRGESARVDDVASDLLQEIESGMDAILAERVAARIQQEINTAKTVNELLSALVEDVVNNVED
jgi:hypothetical protein